MESFVYQSYVFTSFKSVRWNKDLLQSKGYQRVLIIFTLLIETLTPNLFLYMYIFEQSIFPRLIVGPSSQH